MRVFLNVCDQLVAVEFSAWDGDMMVGRENWNNLHGVGNNIPKKNVEISVSVCVCV